ncbi:MAG: hypothetical protein PW788_11115 [Micavibrio sp.]|nr:hypothetical protein [Micavibrio sp.]
MKLRAHDEESVTIAFTAAEFALLKHMVILADAQYGRLDETILDLDQADLRTLAGIIGEIG